MCTGRRIRGTPLDDEGWECYNTLTLHSPEGKEFGRYRRTTPSRTPWIYKGGRYWEFDWVNANDLPVFKTELGTIGIIMCSEVYATECARDLAIKGRTLRCSRPSVIVVPDVEDASVGARYRESDIHRPHLEHPGFGRHSTRPF